MIGKEELLNKEAVQRMGVRWTVEDILRDVFSKQLSFTNPTNEEVQHAVDHAVHEMLHGLFMAGLLSGETNSYPSIPLVFPKERSEAEANHSYREGVKANAKAKLAARAAGK
jgi:hypothetical protein